MDVQPLKRFTSRATSSPGFVVVELKRGKSSGAVIAQTLAYIMWVNENCAKPGRATQAIIIVAEADEAMR
jgi:hypothetical protein